MVELSRRFFLGGAISLLAASTFVPSINAMANMPTIYGNGKDDDTEGLGALFRKEPVIFKKDQIGVDSHKGLKFHKGDFIISNSIHIPKDTAIDIERARFIGIKLPDDFPFFICDDDSGKGFASSLEVGVQTIFVINSSHKTKFVTYPINDYEDVGGF